MVSTSNPFRLARVSVHEQAAYARKPLVRKLFSWWGPAEPRQRSPLCNSSNGPSCYYYQLAVFDCLKDSDENVIVRYVKGCVFRVLFGRELSRPHLPEGGTMEEDAVASSLNFLAETSGREAGPRR